MATISDNLALLQNTKANIKTAIENLGVDLTNVPFIQYDEKMAEIKVGGKPNFELYLVKYVEQEDGTYEMQITDYAEGGQGNKILIGTIENEETEYLDMYVVEGGV